MPEQDDKWRWDPPLDFHDPTARIGGAPPAASALVLRTWLAAGALGACVAGIVASALLGAPVVLIVVLAVVAVTAVIDLAVISRRRRATRT